MVYCSWDMAHNGCDCYFSFWAISCSFTSLTARKIQIEKKKKWKKRLEILSFYNCVPKLTIICYTVPEIWHMTDVTIFHSEPFFGLLPPPPPPPYPLPNTRWIKIKKIKKTHGDIIILCKCTKSHDDMLYCSCDMTHDRWNCYFSSWAIFCPFTP